jgi:hypothetical protein
VPAAPVLAFAGRDLERPRGAPASAERVGQSAFGRLTDQGSPNTRCAALVSVRATADPIEGRDLLISRRRTSYVYFDVDQTRWPTASR